MTYYDEQGRRFSREDYGQQSNHGETIGLREDGRSNPHEHLYQYNERGYSTREDVYRKLTENGEPDGPWLIKKKKNESLYKKRR
ncbi:hypothetical protein [Thalassomonas haliotis]|uniref:Rhs family protein n=1 Tax=Thalassomonas haliotis TaxID=485448 RepID=A0ABY7VGW8_9GAMM|nr:hypothetical protein [Thalassomonas haliotis]WDE12947.1 hypothetical protein H3N35_05675 [Thalassomonas haliotis]